MTSEIQQFYQIPSDFATQLTRHDGKLLDFENKIQECLGVHSPCQKVLWCSVWSIASNEGYPKVRHHGEGPYQGLLLVESGYYRFHI